MSYVLRRYWLRFSSKSTGDVHRNVCSVIKMETILLMQRAFKRERVFRDRSQPLDFLNDVDLISRYRFPRRVLKELINVVDVICRPAKNRSHSIPTQAERYQREKHRDFHVRKRLKEKWANCFEWENYSLEELFSTNPGAEKCQRQTMWLPLNILFLFLLVIIYPIVLNLNTCININNEYNTRVVWKNTY